MGRESSVTALVIVALKGRPPRPSLCRDDEVTPQRVCGACSQLVVRAQRLVVVAAGAARVDLGRDGRNDGLELLALLVKVLGGRRRGIVVEPPSWPLSE